VDFATFQKLLEDNIGGAALTAGESFSGSLANVGAALGRLGAAFLAPAFGEAPGMFGAVTAAIDKLTDAVGPLAEWMSRNPASVKAVAGALAGLAVALGIAAAAQWIMNSALLASPLTWVIVGIVALVAALALLVANWDKVVGWLKRVWGSVVGWLGRVWANIRAAMSAAWRGMVEDARREFGEFTAFVRSIPGRIKDALGNLRDLLKNAGRQIIAGFLRGLKEKWSEVTGWIKGIGSWIANNKGPKAYDLALLRPAGGWIMQGLRDGLEANVPKLRATLRNISGELAATPLTLGADIAGGARSGVQIGTVNVGSRRDYDEMSVRLAAVGMVYG